MRSRDKNTRNGLPIEIASQRRSLKSIFTPKKDENIVQLVIKNNGEAICNCRVIVEGFEYYYQHEWMSAPNGYARKALNWGPRNKAIKGELDIAFKGSKQIEIVKARRIPNPHFKIPYDDVSAGRTHHLLGKYKLQLKIEANTAGKADQWNIEAAYFDIYFEYEKTLKISVKEIVRVC